MYKPWDERPENWRDRNHFRKIMRKIPRYYRSILLEELLDRSMSIEEIGEYLYRVVTVFGSRKHITRRSLETYKSDTEYLIEIGVLEMNDGAISLTPKGRDIAEYLHDMIAFSLKRVLSAETASVTAIVSHVVLTVVKLFFGVLSGSAGLIADAIDNAVDTVASVLVWMGIRFKREKLTSFFILMMMFISVAGVFLASYNKITDMEPIEFGLETFLVSAVCGFYMLILSSFQYGVGRMNANFVIMCQAVDSRNHFLTSMLVCAGIALYYLAGRFNSSWLYYADATVGIIVGILLLKSAVELLIELFKPEGEVKHVPHFLETFKERTENKLILDWTRRQLKEKPLTELELRKRFFTDFHENIPRIMMLAGYIVKRPKEIREFLNRFVAEKKIAHTEGRYSLG